MPNIKDIAKKAGVSVATVSRALARPDIVKKETLEKVNKAIRAVDYTPNALASSLRRQRSDTVIVVVPDIHNPFYSGIVQGIENVAHERGFRILLGETKDEQSRLDRYADMLMGKQADGLILIGSLMPSNFDEAEPMKGQPIVLACEYSGGLKLPSVRVDNVQAAVEAVGYLAALGHVRIGTITGPMDNRLGRDRLEGYRLGMERAGLPVHEELIVSGAFTLDSGTEAMQRMLTLRDRPSAVFCANDEMAIGAIRALNEASLWVPADCSIIGFDDIRFAEYASPPLTTIAQPNIAIGEAAMRLMLDQLNARSTPDEVVLPHKLIVRRSTASISERG